MSIMNESTIIQAANEAYYKAFRTGDDALMGRIWDEGDVSVIHPGWPAITGRKQVLESYRRIMSNPMQDAVVAEDIEITIMDQLARVICTERVGEAGLIATNLFRKTGDLWRMIHHQASPLAFPLGPRAGSLN
jgi:ketosteroid isomerase-like protein